jgi:C4-dicarboxylate-specific signal transduction histidine kinase
MGVGLAISRLFAEVMGGCLVVAPDAPGARVTLRLRTAA